MSDSSELRFKVAVDENHVPEAIAWSAEGMQEAGIADALLIGLWDPEAKNSMRMDLWTKNMNVEDMKIFFHQSLLSMADTFSRATGEEIAAKHLRDFAMAFGEDLGIIKQGEG